MPSPDYRVGMLLWFGPITLGLFLTAGYFKSTPYFEGVPIDLTVVFGALTAGACFWAIGTRGRVPRSVVPTLTLFGWFAMPLIWSSWGGYTTSKVGQMFTLTLLAGIAPPILIRSLRQMRILMWTFAVVGGLVSLDALVNVRADILDLERLTTSSGADPINLARAAGLACLWAFLLGLTNGVRRALLITTVPLMYVIIRAGGRGSLLAVLVSITVISALGHRRQHLLIGAVVAAAAIFGLAASPDWIIQRVTTVGTSGSIRAETYKETLWAIGQTPGGVGWGDFGDRITTFQGADREYPHNIILEVALEGGWLTALLFGRYLFRALRAARSSAEIPEGGKVILALLVYWVVNASFSADINGNRALFAACGLAFAYQALHAASKPPSLNHEPASTDQNQPESSFDCSSGGIAVAGRPAFRLADGHGA